MANRTFAIVQDPNDVLDYVIDYTDLDTDDIFTSTWSVPSPLTQPHPASKTLKTTTVWITGGVAGAEYVVTNHIVSIGGRELDVVLKFRMKEQI